MFPEKQGGRGLMQLEAPHAVEITKLLEYVDMKEDPRIQVVRTHQHNTNSAVLQTTSGENKTKMARKEDAWTIAT
jgi:hypothetical protein